MMVSLDKYNLATWLSLQIQEQDEAVSALCSFLGTSYTHLFTWSYSHIANYRVPTFKHLPSGLKFNLIFSGIFSMGLSPVEESYLLSGARAEEFYVDTERMKPFHTVKVHPFLMAQHPCTKTFAQRYMALTQENTNTLFEQCNNVSAMQMTRENAVELAHRFDFTLPSEAQWEYACRGNTQTPFYFGASLPADDVLERQMLFNDFSDPEDFIEAGNPFGLVGLHVGEWCQDTYTSTYQNASNEDAPIEGGAPYVVRGGGALAWPWQGCGEWQFCMSANRMRSDMFSNIVDVDTWAVRFVKRLF